MIQILDRTKNNVLGIKVGGLLHDSDYQEFVPVVDAVIKERGAIRLLWLFEDFRGWDPKAMWDDLKFGVQHYTSVERVAVVGQNLGEKLLAQIYRPFTKAKVRYFDQSELAAAWQWLEETA